MIRKVCLCRAFASVVLLGSAVLQSEAGFVKLAESGQGEPAPHGTNVFFEIAQNPTLNSEGQVAFYTDLRNAGFLQGFGIYLADQAGVTTIARAGEPAPDLNGNFYSFGSLVALNSTSQVFQANLHGSLGG